MNSFKMAYSTWVRRMRLPFFSSVWFRVFMTKGPWVISSELITQGPFVMNTRNHTLEKNGNRIRLTQVEYAILKLFMQNPGRALSREDILAAVWGRDYDGELKIVDVNIRRLRIKIEDDTANPTYITTVWGLGYKWGA